MRKLKLGIIGTGIATTDLYWPQLKQLKAKIEIVAVANRRISKAKAFAKLAGVKHVAEGGDALLARPDVEAVMISLPINLNAQWVIKALKAGKHVICEKPIASNPAEGARLIKAAAKYKKLWMVGENYYFVPSTIQARNWIKAGKIGRLHLIEAAQLNRLVTSNKYYKTTWRQKPKYIGGFVVDAGVHISNIAREVAGMPVAVKNMTARYNPALVPIDTAVAALKFKSGALGIWRSCFSAVSPSRMPLLKVFGSKGTVEIYDGHAVLYPLKGKPVTVNSKHDGFYHQFDHFADAVVKGTKLRFKPQQALQDLEFMQMVVK